MEKYVFSPVLFLCMIFAEITFCPSISLEHCGLSSFSSFSYVSAKLRNAPVPDFICTTEFTSFEREYTATSGFVLSRNITYLVMFPSMLCILAVM